MLRGGDLKEIYEMKGQGYSGRAIAQELGLARNTVLKYLNSPQAIPPNQSSNRAAAVLVP